MSEASVKSPSRRRQNRIAAMQFLYSCDLNPPQEPNEAVRQFFENLEHEREYYSFGEELVQGAFAHLAEVDSRIRQHAMNWSFHRIAKVDLAILRLAMYELLFREDIPPVVTINEAVDIAKDFSADDSKRFINGILDRIRLELDRPARSPNTPTG